MVHRAPALYGLARSRWWLAGLRQAQVIGWLSNLSLSGIWAILRRLRVHYKRGRRHVHSPDLDYDTKLSAVQAARRQAEAAPERIVLLYQDEMSYWRQPSIAQAYGQAAQDDVRAQQSYAANTRRRIAASLDALTGRVVALQRASFHRRNLLAFFRQVEAAYPAAQRIYLVLDNWPVHFHPDVLAGLRAAHSKIVLLPLPSYAPWTNPVEKLWRKLHQEVQEVLHLHHLADTWPALQRLIDSWLAQFAFASPSLLRYVGLL